MFTFLLPKKICYKFDKLARHFERGINNGSTSGFIPINWAFIYKSKQVGGLTFRNLTPLNIIYIVKLPLQIVKQEPKSWVNLVITKYLSPSNILDLSHKLQ